MKKIGLLFIALIFSCSKNESGMDPHLTAEETIAVQAENEKKLAGKWSFNPSAGRSLATCQIRSLEFTDNNTYILKLNITDGSSNVMYYQGDYHIVFGEATTDDVPIEKVLLFNQGVLPLASIPEAGTIATFTNIVFDTQGGITVTFKAESGTDGYCDTTTAQQLEADKEPEIMTETQAPEGSNQALFINNWRFTEVSSSLNGVSENTEGSLCGWINEFNYENCVDETEEIDPNCVFVNDITVVITSYGTWFFTFYSNSNALGFQEGQWRWANGDFTAFEVIDEEDGENWTGAQLINIVSVSGGSLLLSSTETGDLDGDGAPDEILQEYTLQIESAAFSYPTCSLPTN